MEDIIFWLRQIPGNSFRAWIAIERELLHDSPSTRELGSITLLAGAIMQTVPEPLRNDNLSVIQSLAETAWRFYESLYKSDPAYFNEHRLNLRQSVKGLLASPLGRPKQPDSMNKKNKAWSMPTDDWDWLESQSNQSETIRQAIALFRQQSQP